MRPGNHLKRPDVQKALEECKIFSTIRYRLIVEKSIRRYKLWILIHFRCIHIANSCTLYLRTVESVPRDGLLEDFYIPLSSITARCHSPWGVDGCLRVQVPPSLPTDHAGVRVPRSQQDPGGPPQLLHEALLPAVVNTTCHSPGTFTWKNKVFQFFRKGSNHL